MKLIALILSVLILIQGCSSQKSSTNQTGPTLSDSNPKGNSPDIAANQNKPGNPWRAGSPNCQEPHYEYRSLAKNSVTIRQSKCLNYEAPFIHVLIGAKEAFVMDTGAVGLPTSLELRELVFNLVDETGGGPRKILVGHTHSHGDHTAGDSGFSESLRTQVISTDLESVKKFFKIQDWPLQIVQYDLGQRVLDIIPIPGHDETSIAVYDRQTKILYTGDSFYPGRLYINDYDSYKKSIQRLIDFSSKNEIKLILGTHIEMSKTAKEDYPIGSTYHPNEAPLELGLDDLKLLNETLKTSNPKDYIRLDKFIIYPVFR